MRAFAIFDPKLKQVAVDDNGQLMIFTAQNIAMLDRLGEEIVTEITIAPALPMRRREAERQKEVWSKVGN